MPKACLAVIALFAGAGCVPADEPDPATLDRKVLLGYQGWFACPEDGGGRWTHWSRGVPAPETLTVDMYPDLSEFDADELCEVPGRPSVASRRTCSRLATRKQ